MLSLERHPLVAPGKMENHAWRRVDLLGIAAGVLYTFVITVVLSRGRIFWEDEMLAWMLLTDSWHHMLYAWRLGADGGGFVFYLTARAWLHVFGTSELAFRFYSSTCFALAFVVMWIAARRYYRSGIVAFALFNTWFFSPPFTLHMREGRFYGLLILAVSLAVWLTLALGDRMGQVSKKFWVAMFCVHALLTTSHLLGVAFSAVLITALVAIDLSHHHLRASLYFAGMVSWLLLLLEHSNIAASAAVGKPHFWVPQPGLAEFALAYSGWSPEIATVLCVLLTTIALVLRKNPPDRQALQNGFSRRRSVLILTGALLTPPVSFVVEGFFLKSLFAERYLLPVNLALVFVTAEACTIVLATGPFLRLKDRPAAWTNISRIFVLAFVTCLLIWDFHHVREFTPSVPDYTDELTRMLPRSVPVVVEDGFSFTELIGRQHASGVHYVFLLDWKAATDPGAPQVEVTQYHLMENWRKVGYFAGAIESSSEFLQKHPKFLVIYAGPPGTTINHEIGNPIVETFRKNPQYEVRPYATLQRPGFVDVVSLVCRGTCSAEDALAR